MAVFTISAVDTVTERLTSVAHGLVTGDGPGAVFNFSASGTIPAGLTTLTDYWIIRIDNDTFQLATSSSNAFAGVAVNLTGGFIGNLQLGIGIPHRRARTYAALAQVRSADLNSLMDTFVSVWNLLTGQAQSLWATVKLAIGLTLDANQHVTLSGSGEYKHGDKSLTQGSMVAQTTFGTGHSVGAAASQAPFVRVTASAVTIFPIYGLRQGMRIKAVKVRGTAVAEPSPVRLLLNNATVASVIATTNTGNLVTINLVTMTLDAPITIGSNDEYYHVSVAAAAGGTADVYALQIVYDIP